MMKESQQVVIREPYHITIDGPLSEVIGRLSLSITLQAPSHEAAKAFAKALVTPCGRFVTQVYQGSKLIMRAETAMERKKPKSLDLQPEQSQSSLG